MKIFFILLYLASSAAFADKKKEVLLYDSNSVIIIDQQIRSRMANAPEPKAKPIDSNIFESTIKDAITVLENSMRKTCAKEMETNISITAEGNWAVVGVSITGAIKLLISNPDKPKTCSK